MSIYLNLMLRAHIRNSYTVSVWRKAHCDYTNVHEEILVSRMIQDLFVVNIDFLKRNIRRRKNK
jgi:hypothetical protein